MALVAGAAAGVPGGTLRTVFMLVVSPLWCLLPYLGLRWATRGIVRVAGLFGVVAALPAVGVPGDGASHLAPPSLVAVCLAVAQTGVFLLARSRRPRHRAWVAAINRAALPVVLGHQSVLPAAVAGAALLGIPGLVGAPEDAGWVVARIMWIPVLAAALTAVIRRGRAWRRTRRPVFPRGRAGSTLVDGSCRARLLMEVIAVRDSDPPSRGRAARQPF